MSGGGSKKKRTTTTTTTNGGFSSIFPAAVAAGPTVSGSDPYAGLDYTTGFQDNPALSFFLKEGRLPTSDELYGKPVKFGDTGITPVPGGNTGVVNPGGPDAGMMKASAPQYTGKSPMAGQNQPYDPQYQYVDVMDGAAGPSPWDGTASSTGYGGRAGGGGRGGEQPGYGYTPGAGQPSPTGDLYNGGVGYSYPTDNAGYFYVNPNRTGKKAASETMADLARAEYADYERRYIPIEDALINTVKKENYKQNVTNREQLRTALSIGNSYKTVAGSEERRMGRFGIVHKPDPNMGLDQAGAMVGGLNSTARLSEDRRLALVSGGMNKIATDSKSGVKFGEAEDNGG